MPKQEITAYKLEKTLASDEFPVTRLYGTKYGKEKAKEVSLTGRVILDFTDYQFKEGNRSYPRNFFSARFKGPYLEDSLLEERAKELIQQRFGPHVRVDIGIDSESTTVGWNTFGKQFYGSKTYGTEILKFLNEVEIRGKE